MVGTLTVNLSKRLGVNSLTGAGAGADPFSDYHTDQSTSGSLQQVQSLPVSVVAGATCATASITSSTTLLTPLPL